MTEPGERVGVLVPNVNAAAVVFFALQAFGRVPAMLNFSAGPANLEAARGHRPDQAGDLLGRVRRQGQARARRSPPSAATPSSSGSRTCAARSRTADRLRGLLGRPVRRAASTARCGVERDDPAVVLFTSGSEGRPKGVVLSHGNILANCAQISARVDFNQQDKVFNALPVFHSFGLTGAHAAADAGRRRGLHVPLAAALPDRPGAGLRQQCRRSSSAPTASSRATARMGDPYDFRSLRYAFAGAEAIQDETQKLWFDKFGIRILTGYGATETAPVLSLNTPMHYRWGTVGRLLPGIEHRLEPVAGLERGGRLWVKGPNVMLGYLRYEQPGVLEPPEDGWYDTGDIVELDARGLRHHPRPRQALRQDRRRDGEPGRGRGVRPPPQPRGASTPSWPCPTRARASASCWSPPTSRLDRDTLLKAAREGGVNELMLPAEVLHRPDLPLLGTGKTDYPSVQKIVTGYLAAA